MNDRRAPTRYRLMTGTYSLQSNRCAQNMFFPAVCHLYGIEAMTRQHFITISSKSINILSDTDHVDLKYDIESEAYDSILNYCLVKILLHYLLTVNCFYYVNQSSTLISFSLHSTRRKIVSVYK